MGNKGKGEQSLRQISTRVAWVGLVSSQAIGLMKEGERGGIELVTHDGWVEGQGLWSEKVKHKLSFLNEVSVQEKFLAQGQVEITGKTWVKKRVWNWQGMGPVWRNCIGWLSTPTLQTIDQVQHPENSGRTL